MYVGQVIEYQISPGLSIPLYCMREITHIEDKKYFWVQVPESAVIFWENYNL